MKKIFFALIFCFCVAATFPVEQRVHQIAEQLRCPVCRGIPIVDSPSELAQNMVGVIREKIKEGKTNEEILNYFVERYGEWILLKPKAAGFNLIVWILPMVVLAGGLGMLIFIISKWSRSKNNR